MIKKGVARMMEAADRKGFRLALGSVLALGLVGAASQADAKPTWEGHEKCYGVSKKGLNDCHNAEHRCGGRAKVDGASDEWVYLPEGTCEKIVGGSVEAKKDSAE